MAAEADNLDARMEAIRLKNEELEKKHKEIMEDELQAKKENAIVNLKQQSEKHSHPYDKLDLDFDVKEAEKELAKNPEKPKSKLSHRASCICTSFSCFLLVFDQNRSPTDAEKRIPRRNPPGSSELFARRWWRHWSEAGAQSTAKQQQKCEE